MTETPSPAARRPGRVWVGWLLRLGISAVVLTIIFQVVPVAEVWREARKLPPALWLGGLAAFLVGHALSAAKWRLLIGEGVAYPEALRAHLAGLAANLCLPSVAGGDVVRAGLLIKRVRDPARLAAGSVADRLLDTLGLVLIAAVGGLVAFGGGADARHDLVLIGAALLIGLVVTFAGVLIANRLLATPRGQGRLGQMIRSVTAAITGLAREPKRLAMCLALSMLVQTLFVCINIVFANAAGIGVPPSAWFFAWSSAKIIAIAPVSLGGLGVREGSTAVLLRPFGAAPEPVIAVGLLWQTLLYASGLIGLLAQALWRPAGSGPNPADARPASTAESAS